MVVIIIPKKSAPFTFLASNRPVIIKPIRASKGPLEVIFPKPTMVPSPGTTTPAFTRPIRAMKSPIPTETAFFKFIGIASNMASLTLTSDSSINIIPSMNTAVSANCQDLLMPNTTE